MSLYACADWAPLAHAEVGTSDLEGLAFAPDGTCLAAWDSPLQYGVVVLALDGSPLARYRAYEDALGVKCASWAPSGQLLAVGSYDQARPRPGVRWASGGPRARRGGPCGAQEARLLDHASWLPAASLAHPEHLADAPAGFVAFREVGAAAPPARGPAGDAAKAGARGAVRVMAGAGRAAGEGAGAPAAQEQPRAPPATHYVVVGLPLRLPAARPVLDKPALRMGIGAPGLRNPAPPAPAAARRAHPRARRAGKALWSADGQFLATGNDAQPECVWLWSAARLALAAVVQQVPPAAERAPQCGPYVSRGARSRPAAQTHADARAVPRRQAAAVQDMAWSPCEPRLALVCGGPRLYLWSAEGASCVSIPPAHFQASSVRWGPSGGSLVIADAASGRFCCAYFA